MHVAIQTNFGNVFWITFSSKGTPVFRVLAIDGDLGIKDKITYTIQSKADIFFHSLSLCLLMILSVNLI